MKVDSPLAAAAAAAVARALPRQRWFGGKARTIGGHTLLDHLAVESGDGSFVLLFMRIAFADGGNADYFIPLSVSRSAPEHMSTLDAEVSNGERTAFISDALHSPEFMKWIFGRLGASAHVETEHGMLHFVPAPGFEGYAAPSETKVVSSEQSNTSVIVDGRTIYKSYRRPEEGSNPDYEIPLMLTTEGSFAFTPRPLGRIDHELNGLRTVGSLSQFVDNEGDCWTYFLGQLSSHLANTSGGEVGSCMEEIGRLADITAMMHNALSAVGGEHFSPVEIGEPDGVKWRDDYLSLLETSRSALTAAMGDLDSHSAVLAESFLGSRAAMANLASSLSALTSGGVHRIRIHGDYHLGQVLKAGDTFYVIDFEGEPMRPLEYRRAPHCALRDVAGMLRSIDYAASFTYGRLGDGCSVPRYTAWRQQAPALFIERYLSSYSPGKPYLPPVHEDTRRSLLFFVAEKAIYELNYELNNRPDWAWIPLSALADIAGGQSGKTFNRDSD